MSKENEEVVNETAEIKEVNKKSTKKTEKIAEPVKKAATPFLFFKKDNRIEIAIDGYHSNETGELQFVLTPDNDEFDQKELESLFTKVTYKFWFSRVPYNKLNRYRSRSMIYNSEDQNNTINELQLREYFLVYHLVDWDLKDEEGNKVELTFDPNGALSDKTLDVIYSLPSILIDAVLTNFEKKAAIA
jgi:hypothetical protein